MHRVEPARRAGDALSEPQDQEGGTRRRVGYSFLFMRADGDQLRKIADLVDAGTIRPVVDRVFPFEATREALAYVETGRAKGKVVIKMK